LCYVCAAAKALTAIFGDIGSFTDHTYDYLGFAPRTFSSFHAIGEDVAHARVLQDFIIDLHAIPRWYREEK
jgi:hypothetical protein